ncbi:zinc ribbon domain-containing protein [bacterium]|nr:zinc ribbon domain-containing protein [bacterium]
MPIFEYQCADCGAIFEELVPNSEAKVTCPKCQSSETKKLFSMFASSSGSSGSAGSFGPGCSTGGCGSGGFS